MDYVAHGGWCLLLVLPVAAFAPEMPPSWSAALLGGATYALFAAIGDIFRRLVR